MSKGSISKKEKSDASKRRKESEEEEEEEEEVFENIWNIGGGGCVVPRSAAQFSKLAFLHLIQKCLFYFRITLQLSLCLTKRHAIKTYGGVELWVHVTTAWRVLWLRLEEAVSRY
jgi:hypothetical protein